MPQKDVRKRQGKTAIRVCYWEKSIGSSEENRSSTGLAKARFFVTKLEDQSGLWKPSSLLQCAHQRLHRSVTAPGPKKYKAQKGAGDGGEGIDSRTKTAVQQPRTLKVCDLLRVIRRFAGCS